VSTTVMNSYIASRYEQLFLKQLNVMSFTYQQRKPICLIFVAPKKNS